MLEQATYPRRRVETLPDPRVLYPRRELFEDLRRSGERLARFADLPEAAEGASQQEYISFIARPARSPFCRAPTTTRTRAPHGLRDRTLK
jgi:hypothetical protein